MACGGWWYLVLAEGRICVCVVRGLECRVLCVCVADVWLPALNLAHLYADFLANHTRRDVGKR